MVESEEITEDELREIANRRLLFEKFGLTEAEAFDLALSAVETVYVAELVKRGCPPRLVNRICL
jgi:hypothetical protein